MLIIVLSFFGIFSLVGADVEEALPDTQDIQARLQALQIQGASIDAVMDALPGTHDIQEHLSFQIHGVSIGAADVDALLHYKIFYINANTSEVCEKKNAVEVLQDAARAAQTQEKDRFFSIAFDRIVDYLAFNVGLTKGRPATRIWYSDPAYFQYRDVQETAVVCLDGVTFYGKETLVDLEIIDYQGDVYDVQELRVKRVRNGDPSDIFDVFSSTNHWVYEPLLQTA